jgi:hypothetical protein
MPSLRSFKFAQTKCFEIFSVKFHFPHQNQVKPGFWLKNLCFCALLMQLFTLPLQALGTLEDPITFYVNNTATFDGDADGSEGKPFSTIQAAIDGIVAIYTVDTHYHVSISAGLYLETLLIRDLSHVHLQGSGPETILGPDRAYATDNNAVLIDNSHHITLSNIQIDGTSNPALTGSTFVDGVRYSTRGGNHNSFQNLIIRGVDRRGISIFPNTSVGTLIQNSRIENITGAVNGRFNGSVGIVLNGLGSILNNTVVDVHTGIIVNSGPNSGSVLIENNVLEDFKTDNVILNTGISVWSQNRQTFSIRNNRINSNAPKQVGMYLNASFDPATIVADNHITLSGEYSIGMDVHNHLNPSGGYTLENNRIQVGQFSTGIALSNVGINAEQPMLLRNNTLINDGISDDFETSFDYTFLFDRAGTGREVGILISTSLLTKRVQDTNSTRSFITLQENTIEGFKHVFAYVQDPDDVGEVEDLIIINNLFSAFETDFLYGTLSVLDGALVFDAINLSVAQREAFILNNPQVVSAPREGFSSSDPMPSTTPEDAAENPAVALELPKTSGLLDVSLYFILAGIGLILGERKLRHIKKV